MRTTAGILVLGVLAWVAGPGLAADTTDEKPVTRKPLLKVFEKKGEVKQCGCTSCGSPATLGAPVSAGVVHETNCPKSSDGCCDTVCMGTTTRKCAPRRHQTLIDWLTYRPLESSKCCAPSIQPMPCRPPHVWTYFSHRCCNCENVGVVDSSCCDGHGCGAAAPCCQAATAPAPVCKAGCVKKPLLARKKATDQFATDVAQPVSYQEVKEVK